MKLNTCSWALGLVVGAGFVSSAAAQGAPQEEGAVELTVAPRKSHIARRSGPVGPLRFYGGFNLDVGGNFIDKSDNNVAVGGVVVNVNNNGSADADPTVGFQGGIDYVLMDYFAIGGEMRFDWAKVDGNSDRIFLWDMVVKPRGRYQLNNLPLELYGALPVGLSVSNWDNDSGVDGSAGATLGLLGGANYFFTDHMGVNAELGAMFHWIHGTIDGPLNRQYDVHTRLAQFALLHVNFVYAL